ncbi:MAG: DUF4287 domain-containing protein [Hyphomicrobiaceae bacterium]|nr:DUF4287 domain-containing protein [Hyphomicrobiaceae bacterium]
MDSHFVDKERAFIDGLPADTGHALGDWMAMIDASGLRARNDVIDWLRQRGFTFAKASWLERIHHNNGKPIYAAASMTAIAIDRAPAVRRLPPKPALKPDQEQPSGPSCEVGRAARATNGDASIEQALAAAKAYRPLAQVLLREVLGAVPGADTRSSGEAIVFELAAPFAAMVPGPKGVRLCLPDRLGPPALFQPARTGIISGLVSNAMLTDVRQIDAVLLAAVADAARRQA